MQNVLRLAGLPPNAPYMKIHRVGLWKGANANGPRPLLVVFTSTYMRDLLLSRATRVENGTNGCITITPDGPNRAKTVIPARALAQVDTEPKKLELIVNRIGEPMTKSTPKVRNENNIEMQKNKVQTQIEKDQCDSDHEQLLIKPLSQIRTVTEVSEANGNKTLCQVQGDRSDTTDSQSEPGTWVTVVNRSLLNKQLPGSPPVRKRTKSAIDLIKDCDRFEEHKGKTTEEKNEIAPRVLRPRGPCN